VGLATAGGLAEIAAGVLGTAATWVASTGSISAGREAQTPRLAGACERQARVFGGGARRCLGCCVGVSAPPQINGIMLSAPLLYGGRPSVLWGVSWFPTCGPPAGGHRKQEVAASACASAGAERRGGVLCVGPAYVVLPQGGETKRERKTLFKSLQN
jgi:hypothetical protein